MVRIEEEGPEERRDERFDAMIRRLVDEHGLHCDVTGWTRKTFDVYGEEGRNLTRPLLMRVESFAMTNGEILVFDESAIPLATAIGTALEADFGVAEAVLVRRTGA